jgi:hypothetical protein
MSEKTNIELYELNQMIADELERFWENAAKARIGNKAAAARARRSTTKLEKLFKTWRRLTIAEAKKDHA